MQKTLLFTAGVITGIATLLSGFVYMTSSTGESAENQLSQSMAERNIAEQTKLGMQCSDGREFVRNYLNSLTPAMVRLQRGERLLPSDPLLGQGERVREVLFTCSVVHANALAGRIPSPVPLGLVNGHAYVSAIVLTVAQSSVDWCESKCIKDSLAKLEELRGRAADELARTTTQ